MYFCNEFIDKVLYNPTDTLGQKPFWSKNSFCLFKRYFYKFYAVLGWMFYKYLVKVLMDEINNAPSESTPLWSTLATEQK